MADSTKAIAGAILSFIIPGLGQLIIGSKHALKYFLGAVAVWILVTIITIITFGICAPIMIVYVAYAVVSAIDAYYEGMGQEDKRILKKYIN